MNLMGYYLNNNNNIEKELTLIYGIGRKKSLYICKKLGIYNLKVKFIDNIKIKILKDILNKNKIGFDLKNKVKRDIKILLDINCYRGVRHKKRLPVRGQRTRTNAKTSKKKFFFNCL
ncbi:ribosomal protein uS13 [Candidatus Vidania fulgoroideorum]